MRTPLILTLVAPALLASFPARLPAGPYPYNGQVNYDVKRDRIIAICEDFAGLEYYLRPENIDYSSYTGATCPDPTIGWKTGMKYCWGGEDTTAIYLLRLAENAGAGNKNTSGSSSTDAYCTGSDCSGMASIAWTSTRQSTSTFGNISDDILWENLRMGDCTNDAGSHIRVFDYYTPSGTLMFYESTSGSGLLWKCVHRSLARDDAYQPIRYNSTYNVHDFPEPSITYVRRVGVERVQIRWDGQADVGFRLYHSADGTAWTRIRDTAELTPTMRACEVSGLLPDTTALFKMTSVNTGGETINSAVVPVRVEGQAPRVLLVDGADRYRQQFSANHTFLTRLAAALAAAGVAYDTCANEAVVDGQIALANYEAAVWVLAEESTFDETFSWPEQKRLMAYLEGGGRLFASGSEIGWDIDYRAGSTTYKNGHPNDAPFYNQWLRADHSGDDADTYQAAGAAASIFDGITVTFDNGTHGTYDVQYPDQLAVSNGSVVGMTYQGGAGGNACVYGSNSTSGTVVNLGFGFESIYPEASRAAVMNAILNYFDVPVAPPTLKSAIQTASTEVAVRWEGHASAGFRLSRKIDAGTWTVIQNETVLGPAARVATVTALSPGTRYAFKITAVNSAGASADSDVLCVAVGAGARILVVDAYDRWNSQSAGANHNLVENYAAALSSQAAPYDSCANEAVASGAVPLSAYPIVMWMCGEESTESETFSAAEQAAAEAYLKAGGRLFVSGAEIGWDLVQKAGTANDYSNGHPNDTPFYQNYLKASYIQDDANSYSVNGLPGTVFEGLAIGFDDGTHGTYNVEYPDVIAPANGSAASLVYGAGPNVAGVSFTGTFPGGTAPGQLVHFGFPFETIWPAAAREAAMADVLEYFGYPAMTVEEWSRF